MKYKLAQEEMEALGLLNPKERETNTQMYDEISMDLPAQKYVKELEKDLTEEDISRVGTRLPRFGITNIALLNAGGLGVIYLGMQSPADNACMRGAGDIDNLKEEARSLGTQRFCKRYDVQPSSLFYACKYLRGNKMSTEKLRQRFVREGRLLKRLTHPGIPHAVYASERVIASTYFPHTISLERLIKTETKRTLREKFEIFKNAMEILSDVRETTLKVRGAAVIHRDVKPSNILCFWPSIPDYSARVIDWGQTNETEEDHAHPGEDTSNITNPDLFEGTPAYGSPEQTKGGLTEYTERSEVYSAGMSLYETLTGFLPFARKKFVQSAMAIMEYANGFPEAMPPDVRKLNNDIPFELAVRVMKAIEAKPENRFGDITEFYEELKFIGDRWPLKKRRKANKKYGLMPLQDMNYKVSARTIVSASPGIAPQTELPSRTLYLVDDMEEVSDNEPAPEATIIPEKQEQPKPKDCSGQDYLKTIDPSLFPDDEDKK